jgi:hypothetical protein
MEYTGRRIFDCSRLELAQIRAGDIGCGRGSPNGESLKFAVVLQESSKFCRARSVLRSSTVHDDLLPLSITGMNDIVAMRPKVDKRKQCALDFA